MRVGKLLKIISIILMVTFAALAVLCGVASGVTNTNVFGLDILGLTGSTAGIVLAVCIGVAGVISMLSLYAYGDMCESMSTLKAEPSNDVEEIDEEVEEEDDDDFDFD